MKKDSLLKRNKIHMPLQAILWSKNIENIDLYEDRVYIIHQILAYGDIEEIKWLFTVYLQDEIKNIFIEYPARIYTRPVYFFLKDYILNIKEDIDENDYVKNIAGSLKQ